MYAVRASPIRIRQFTYRIAHRALHPSLLWQSAALDTRRQGAMTAPRLSRPIHLVLDYDGTLTVKDTMAVLGDLPKEPKMQWQEIVDLYMADYDIYSNTQFPWKHHCRDEYSQWLASRKWVEAKSAERVQNACFFRGVTLDEVNSSVKSAIQDGSLQLRDGWADLIALFLPYYRPSDGMTDGSKVSILSVNWSETAIRRALWESARRIEHPQKEVLGRYINDMEIHANEIEGLGSPEGSSGRVCRPLGADIRTSDDKLRHFLPCKSSDAVDAKPFTVYIGDSSTDFDCLCSANLGIWLCDVPESEYVQIFQKIFAPFGESGIVPPPLHTIRRVDDGRELFYWAPDLATVARILTAG